MKSILSLVSVIVFAQSMAQAREIHCSVQNQKAAVVSIRDDLGSFEGSMDFGGGCTTELNAKDYLYWYGSALSFSQKCGASEVRVLVASAKGNGVLSGKAIIASKEKIDVLNLICQE